MLGATRQAKAGTPPFFEQARGSLTHQVCSPTVLRKAIAEVLDCASWQKILRVFMTIHPAHPTESICIYHFD
jgi:hypothetical protein